VDEGMGCAVSELKTKPTEASVADFIDHDVERELQPDCWELVQMMQEVTGTPARMWGSSIVGFGRYRYVYSSGRSGDWMILGFSPRKQNLSIYLMCALEGRADLLSQLGKHSIGKSCLYVKGLKDINRNVLRELMKAAYDFVAQRYQVLVEEMPSVDNKKSTKSTPRRTVEKKSVTKKVEATQASRRKGEKIKERVAPRTAAKSSSKRIGKTSKKSKVVAQPKKNLNPKAKTAAKKSSDKKPPSKKRVAKGKGKRNVNSKT
jgi:hypothetical protein